MGEFGGPWVGPPTAFAPFVARQMAYISRLYLKASYNKAEKEISTYNTEHSSKGHHHLIARSGMPRNASVPRFIRHYFDQGAKSEGFCRGTLAFLDPSMGKAKSARFFASAKNPKGRSTFDHRACGDCSAALSVFGHFQSISSGLSHRPEGFSAVDETLISLCDAPDSSIAIMTSVT